MGNSKAEVMENRLKKVAQGLRKALKKQGERAEHVGRSIFEEEKQDVGGNWK